MTMSYYIRTNSGDLYYVLEDDQVVEDGYSKSSKYGLNLGSPSSPQALTAS